MHCRMSTVSEEQRIRLCCLGHRCGTVLFSHPWADNQSHRPIERGMAQAAAECIGAHADFMAAITVGQFSPFLAPLLVFAWLLARRGHFAVPAIVLGMLIA